MRVLGKIALISLAAVALLFGAGLGWLKLSEPTRSGSFFAPVSKAVDITFDERARPFVRAATFRDAFTAQGWLHARERLWQMEMFRRAGSGRIAELIGRSGLTTDIDMWRAGVPELAARLEQVASDEVLGYVDSYVSGINAWLAEGEPKPPEFLLISHSPAPWQRRDVFALAALMAYQSANPASDELMRLALVNALGASRAAIFFPSSSVIANPIASEATRTDIELTSLLAAWDRLAPAQTRRHALFTAPSLGSNAWAVSPDMASGDSALFAFDSHDSIGLPNLTYDVHLFVGEQQIRGNSVPGLPGVINGFNEFLAWGFTNIGDSQDLFIETVDKDNPNRFKGRDGWYDGRIESVAIPVANEGNYSLNVTHTQNGRLISESPPISQRWAPLEAPGQGIDALFALNRATSFDQFNTAMDNFVAPSANVTYADITGRISQRTIGTLPSRGRGAGLVPLPGDDPDSAWRGVITSHNLPAQQNPAAGYVAAANRPIHDGEPLVSVDNAPGYRIARLHSALAQTSDHNLASMQALQTDIVNLQAQRLVPIMLAHLDTNAMSALEASSASLLADWAPRAEDAAGSPEPLIFGQWYNAFIDELFADALGDELYQRLLTRRYLINEAIDNHLLAQPNSPANRDWPIAQALCRSFHDAITQLHDRYGSEPRHWRWGDEHHLTMRHQMSSAFPGSQWLLDRGPYSVSGGNATLGRARFSYAAPFAVNGGATTRIIIEMTKPMTIALASPGGQSGWPLSKHYNDQSNVWISGDHDAISSGIPASYEHSLRLHPNSRAAGD